MAYVSLYRKWRPKTFDEVVGQEPVVRALKNQVIYNRIGHAYLFSGTRGTGKTSMAKIFARAVNCEHPVDGNPCLQCEMCRQAESGFNVIEIDAASNNGVDNIREIRDEVRYTPSEGRFRIYIIDEVHMLSGGAFNALLKTLEEPPEHVIFILATTEPHKVLPTVISRCQRYDFKRFTTVEILDHLRKVTEAEGITATEDSLRFIARAADGGMRDALSILEQCVSFYMNEELSLDRVRKVLGEAADEEYEALCEAIFNSRTADALTVVGEAFQAGRDMTVLTDGLITYLRNLLMIKAMGSRGVDLLMLTEEEGARLMRHRDAVSVSQLTYYIEELTALEDRMRYASDKRVLVEVEMIRLCRMMPRDQDPALEARLSALEEQLQVLKKTGIQAEAPELAKVQTVEQKRLEETDSGPAAQDPEVIPADRTEEAVRVPVEKIIDSWHKICSAYGQRSPAEIGMLEDVEITAGSGPDQIVITGLPSVTRERLEQKGGAKLRILEEIIAQETGIHARITCSGEEAGKAKKTQAQPSRQTSSFMQGPGRKIQFPVEVEND